LSPAEPEVLAIVGRIIAYLADAGEGLQIANRFLSLDPLNSRGHRRKAEILLALRRYSEAISTGQRALQLAPKAFSARITIGDSLVLLGRYADALAVYRFIPNDDVYRLKGEALVAARTRDAPRVESLVDRMRRLFGDTPAYQYAEIFSQMNRPDQAFDALATALSARDPGLHYLRTDPLLDPIRDDARFRQLFNRLNFPS
jgi:tetratricopeptide (TPR) repeat protein